MDDIVLFKLGFVNPTWVNILLIHPGTPILLKGLELQLHLKFELQAFHILLHLVLRYLSDLSTDLHKRKWKSICANGDSLYLFCLFRSAGIQDGVDATKATAKTPRSSRRWLSLYLDSRGTFLLGPQRVSPMLLESKLFRSTISNLQMFIAYYLSSSFLKWQIRSKRFISNAHNEMMIWLFCNRTKVAACAKHFVGDGGTINGINENNTIIDRHGLLAIHMPAYYNSIIKGVSTVMVSYSSWNGIKMHANRELVTGFLKNTLQFRVKNSFFWHILWTSLYFYYTRKGSNWIDDWLRKIFFRVLSSQIGKV